MLNLRSCIGYIGLTLSTLPICQRPIKLNFAYDIKSTSSFRKYLFKYNNILLWITALPKKKVTLLLKSIFYFIVLEATYTSVKSIFQLSRAGRDDDFHQLSVPFQGELFVNDGRFRRRLRLNWCANFFNCKRSQK